MPPLPLRTAKCSSLTLQLHVAHLRIIHGLTPPSHNLYSVGKKHAMLWEEVADTEYQSTW